MKYFALLVAVLSSPAFAVLGVQPGKYTGEGTLESQALLIPDLNFVSERELTDDTIVARTKADLFGWVLAEATANLKVVQTGSDGSFMMLDMYSAGALAGAGKCADGKCAFEVTVMGGNLVLRETWIATPEGFKIVNGSQVFQNKAAKYEGRFVRK